MRILTLILISATALLLAGCERPKSHLGRIKDRGELVVATRYGPTTYYEGPRGPVGLEHDLVELFARDLGVSVHYIVPENFHSIIPLVVRGEVDLAAAGLTITEKRKELVRFGPSYQEITPQLVYRRGTKRPKSLDDLDGILEVVQDSSHEEHLRRLRKQHPNLVWSSNPDADDEELLYLVWEKLIDYTIADSNVLAVNQRFYPELLAAFAISDPEPLAWAFRHGEDDSLFSAAKAFFYRIRKDGTLEQLLERYYGHVQKFDYVGTRRYLRHIQTRLPRYIDYFKEAADIEGLDWRLLAAVGYQESHWNPKARSPTGVRGIMMLTLDTMRHLGLSNRLDPRESILGGARYLAMMKRKIPERIPEPDRTWLALAAYNIGFGHLEDARRLTQMLGGNPDRWADVKKYLPLLSQKKWYRKLKHGYARGREPVRYVENIRSYYDILVWQTERAFRPLPEPPREIITELGEFPSL